MPIPASCEIETDINGLCEERCTFTGDEIVHPYDLSDFSTLGAVRDVQWTGGAAEISNVPSALTVNAGRDLFIDTTFYNSNVIKGIVRVNAERTIAGDVRGEASVEDGEWTLCMTAPNIDMRSRDYFDSPENIKLRYGSDCDCHFTFLETEDRCYENADNCTVSGAFCEVVDTHVLNKFGMEAIGKIKAQAFRPLGSAQRIRLDVANDEFYVVRTIDAEDFSIDVKEGGFFVVGAGYDSLPKDVNLFSLFGFEDRGELRLTHPSTVFLGQEVALRAPPSGGAKMHLKNFSFSASENPSDSNSKIINLVPDSGPFQPDQVDQPPLITIDLNSGFTYGEWVPLIQTNSGNKFSFAAFDEIRTGQWIHMEDGSIQVEILHPFLVDEVSFLIQFRGLDTGATPVPAIRRIDDRQLFGFQMVRQVVVIDWESPISSNIYYDNDLKYPKDEPKCESTPPSEPEAECLLSCKTDEHPGCVDWDSESGPNESISASIPNTFREAVTQEVRDIFSRSGVSLPVFSTTDTNWNLSRAQEANTTYVRFGDQKGDTKSLLEGWAYKILPENLAQHTLGLDRFNRFLEGEVAVFLDDQISPSPSTISVAKWGGVIAHEIGHALGLRHIAPDTQDPKQPLVMDYEDYDINLNTVFSDTPRRICEPPEVETVINSECTAAKHNPVRHIRQWVEESLDNAEVNALSLGDWDDIRIPSEILVDRFKGLDKLTAMSFRADIPGEARLCNHAAHGKFAVKQGKASMSHFGSSDFFLNLDGSSTSVQYIIGYYERGLINLSIPGSGELPEDLRLFKINDDNSLLDSGPVEAERTVETVYSRPNGSWTDSDADGMADWIERQLESNPQDPDSDADGLTDGRELEIGTEINNPDTDGDGYLDGEEVNDSGSDPLSKSDTPGSSGPPVWMYILGK